MEARHGGRARRPGWVNLGCGRCQAIASAAPYPVVTVLVAWSAAARCRAGPDRAPGRAGTGGPWWRADVRGPGAASPDPNAAGPPARPAGRPARTPGE